MDNQLTENTKPVQDSLYNISFESAEGYEKKNYATFKPYPN